MRSRRLLQGTLTMAGVRTLVLGGAVLGLSWLGMGCRQSGANRDAVIRCTPGERVDVSCGCLAIGTVCTGRAGIRLCDASLANGACTAAQAVTSTDVHQTCSDAGDCPLATTFCPQSGLLAVSTFAAPDYAGETGAYTCTWGVRRSAVYPGPSVAFGCTPGERVQASCGCEGLGRFCEGDPTMYACAPGVTCDRAAALAYDDDTCGRCPWVEAVCPADGAIVIQSQALSSGSRFVCEIGAVGQDGRPLVPTGV